ncbi:MAG: PDZ domain-containing protein [Kofleriaceae bacterium]|nr:PDZ domain-containing protein [Kofleriaceae bacterium]
MSRKIGAGVGAAVALRGRGRVIDDNLEFISDTMTGSGTVDLGEITVLKKRLKEGEQAGELGVRFKESPPGADERTFEISFIDPKGAAANSGLKVGDVIVSIDGVDITRDGWSTGWTLLRAPPGTKLELGLARGTSVTVTLKAPS